MLVDISVPRNIDDKGANEVFFYFIFWFFSLQSLPLQGPSPVLTPY